MKGKKLPRSVEIDGIEFNIRSDFRDVLKILEALNDEKLTVGQKFYVCLNIFYKEYSKITNEKKAFSKMSEFIDGGCIVGKSSTKTNGLVAWDKDITFIFIAINKRLGYDCRDVEYMHWWTFMGLYMEIGESIFKNIINIRYKLKKNKNLTSEERDFYDMYRETIEIKPSMTKEEEDFLMTFQ